MGKSSLQTKATKAKARLLELQIPSPPPPRRPLDGGGGDSSKDLGRSTGPWLVQNSLTSLLGHSFFSQQFDLLHSTSLAPRSLPKINAMEGLPTENRSGTAAVGGACFGSERPREGRTWRENWPQRHTHMISPSFQCRLLHSVLPAGLG